MNVLSLFDGMSCGRLALKRVGIYPKKYYASELDKFAIKETQANWPDTVQLGDVTKWREWDIDWSSIDLLIGGSPCQGFSFAGKQLAFDDPRSALFFVYVDILNHIKSVNPNVKFMLENVKMKKEYLNVITEYLGVEPAFINSALVSAQNRQRYYWCNWEIKPFNRIDISLSDIIEHGYLKEGLTKSYCLTNTYYKKGGENTRRRQEARNQRTIVYTNRELTESRWLTVVECCRLQDVPDDYFKISSATQAYKMLGNGWQCNTIERIFKCLRNELLGLHR